MHQSGRNLVIADPVLVQPIACTSRTAISGVNGTGTKRNSKISASGASSRMSAARVARRRTERAGIVQPQANRSPSGGTSTSNAFTTPESAT